jgi:hypothetical protein
MVADTDLAATIQTAAGALGLRARQQCGSAGWQCWEFRSLNRHRAVTLWAPSELPTNPGDLESSIREAVAGDFHISWWQGFAYGMVVDAAHSTWRPEDVAPIVDIYNHRRGVLQWIVVVGRAERTVTAVHTWMETDLSPVYRALLGTLGADGYAVTAAARERSGLLRFLTEVSAIEGVRFPQFRSAAGAAPAADDDVSR